MKAENSPINIPANTSEGLCPKEYVTFLTCIFDFFMISFIILPSSPTLLRTPKESLMTMLANTKEIKNDDVNPSLSKMLRLSALTNAEWLLGMLPVTKMSRQVVFSLFSLNSTIFIPCDTTPEIIMA